MLAVRTARLSELHSDPANARKHDDRNLDAIAASLRSFGQVEPLVVQKSSGRVIGGNGRLEVMRREGAVALWAELMATSSGLGDLVYEPFSGSGTTVVTAEQLKRRCRAIELEPRYVDVAVRRWEALTGLEATLDADGRTFAEVAAERTVPNEKAPGVSGAEGGNDGPH